jgi:hypothetical protein
MGGRSVFAATVAGLPFVICADAAGLVTAVPWGGIDLFFQAGALSGVRVL